MTAEPRFLVCRPRGGFNDTLCEIEKCWRYAEATQRRLIIDSRRSGLHDDFWRYFKARDAFVHILAKLGDEGSDHDVMPRAVAGQLNAYVAEYDESVCNFVEQHTRQRLTFDFSVDHASRILVHEQCWFGEFVSPYCVARISLSDEARIRVNEALSVLGGGAYTAIHIRNTDYRTDYPAFLNTIKSSITHEKVLICSDDFEVFSYAADLFKDKLVIRLSRFADNGGVPLHSAARHDQFADNVDLLADLLGLALSDQLMFTNVQSMPRASGFSMLAHALNRNQHLIRGEWL